MEAQTTTRISNTLTKTDLINWGKETIVFTSPIVVPVLMALQNGSTWQVALGAGYMGLIGAIINLYGKYKAGI